jgi:hypothetical protein
VAWVIIEAATEATAPPGVGPGDIAALKDDAEYRRQAGRDQEQKNAELQAV